MANTPAPMQRAGAFVKGIGPGLEAVMGRDVVLHSYEIEQRPFKGEDSNIVYFDISEIGSEEITTYHAWSDPLAEKIADVPVEQLPMLIKFFKVKTANGYNALTFE